VKPLTSTAAGRKEVGNGPLSPPKDLIGRHSVPTERLFTRRRLLGLESGDDSGNSVDIGLMLVFVVAQRFRPSFFNSAVSRSSRSGRQYLNNLGPRRKPDPALALVDQTSSSFALTRLNRARRLGARTALTSPTGVSIRGYLLALFPGNVFHGVSHHVDDAQLHLRLRKRRFRNSKPLKPAVRSLSIVFGSSSVSKVCRKVESSNANTSASKG
jgi:hypothetical protein